jgi:DNA invertase Pin-like site-specific DNA recombinase
MAFAADRGLSIAAWYVENESGAKLSRPELFRLLTERRPATSCLSSRSIPVTSYQC